MYTAAGIINIKADKRYRWVTATVEFIEIKINPRRVIIGNATSNPAHFESNDLEINVAPTTTAPDMTNCRTIWSVFIILINNSLIIYIFLNEKLQWLHLIFCNLQKS